MIMDTRLMFATALSLNLGAPATYVIGDVIDLSSARDVGNGDPIWFIALMTTAATSGGAATLNLQLVSDSNPNLTTTPTVLLDSGALSIAQLTAKSVIIRAAVPIMNTQRRYLGIKQITTAFAFTAGTFTCGLVDDPNYWISQLALSQV